MINKIEIIFLSFIILYISCALGPTVKYKEDGTCRIIGADGKEELPKSTEYSRVELSPAKCISDFVKHAMIPKCGDPWYNLKKYCAQVHFFDNEHIEKSSIVGKNKDMALVLVNGCIVCHQQNVNYLNLTLSYEWPSGSFFTSCSKTRKSLNPIVIGNKTSKAPHLTTFTIPTVFYQRVCWGLFGTDAMEEEFKAIKLDVEHNCGTIEPQKFSVDLPDFKTAYYTHNVVELRYLELNLNNPSESCQYVGPEEQSKCAKEFEWNDKSL